MTGSLSAEEIEAVLSKQSLGRIGCHADETTYVVPINYLYEDGFLYCYTQEGLKISLMRKNPAICFQTDDMENFANWKSVIAWGNFEELQDNNMRKEALAKMANQALPLVNSERVQQSADWPFTNHDKEEVTGIVFRIRLTKKTGRFEKTQQHK